MKIQPNELCHCNSNKKFKHCCGRIEKQQSFIKDKISLTFILIFVSFIGIAIFGYIKSPDIDPSQSELEWCDNCQRYH